MKQKMKKRVLLILFFASGISGLVYEIVSVRWLTLLTGTSQQAVSLVLAIFFSGLALGSFLAGRVSKRIKRTVFLYGLIEALIGVWALASPVLIKILGNLASSQTSLFLGAVAFLLPPTILLGFTFPLLVKAFGREYVPSLYGLNTLGAVIGVFLAGFFAPPILGLSTTVRLAGLISLAIGLAALKISSLFSVEESKTESKSKAFNKKAAMMIFLILGIGGFASLALEVLWTKILVLLTGGSIYNFSTVLGVYLIGIGLGSILIGKIKQARTPLIFFFSQVAIGIGVLSALFFIDNLPFLLLDVFRKFADNFWLLAAIETAVAGSIILIPTLFMGISFPLAIFLLEGEADKDSGYGYAVNTLGGVLGSSAAGFILIPSLGLQKSILTMGLIYLILAGFFLILIIGIRKWLFLTLVLVFVLSLFIPRWRREVLTSGVYVNANQWLINEEGARLTFYKEGLYGTVTVREFPNGVQILQINGKNEASSDFDADAAVLLGHLPMLVHKNPKDVLLVGLGGGFTLDAITDYNGVARVDVVEIEPAVVEGARTMGEVNSNVLEDSRINMIIDDGRRHLIASQKTYDVIVSQPSNPWLTGVSNLFTKDYYELAKLALSSTHEEEGIMISWLQLYSMPKEDLKIAIKTFLSVFPNTQAWTNLVGTDLILVGGKGDIPSANSAKGIKKLEIDKQGELLGYFLLDTSELREIVEGEKNIHTDNFPILEFSSPKALYRETLSENLELVKSKRKSRAWEWALFRDLLLDAQVAKAQGDLEKAQEFYKKALSFDEDNRQVARLLADIMISRAKKLSLDGKVEEALAFYDEVKEVYPEGFEAYTEKGELLLSRARSGPAFHLATVNMAEEEFSRALELAEYDVQTHTNLGIIYGIYGDYEKSEKEFLRALEINPGSVLAWNNLAKAYLDQRKKAEARDAWEESLKINPRQPEIKKAIMRIKQQL